jgi:aminomethyltransferase
VKLAGLGARDSLRLEAGLCLYGSDLNEEITPVEAGLTWTIGKRRREKYDFLGSETIKDQVENGPSKRRVGLYNAGPPARGHSAITTPEGETVGEVTSGAFSPNLNRNIAMGYAQRPWNKQGSSLKVQVRNKAFDAEAVKMPFVPMKFHRPPEQKQ